MSDLRSARTAMQQAEHLIRDAEALATPARRTESLLQSYRLARPDVQEAFVMGLVARVACAGRASKPEAVTAPSPKVPG